MIRDFLEGMTLLVVLMMIFFGCYVTAPYEPGRNNEQIIGK